MDITCERIRQLRREKGKKQVEIATYLNIDPSNYSKYERGVLQPNLEMIRALCKLYNCSADYILGIED